MLGSALLHLQKCTKHTIVNLFNYNNDVPTYPVPTDLIHKSNIAYLAIILYYFSKTTTSILAQLVLLFLTVLMQPHSSLNVLIICLSITSKHLAAPELPNKYLLLSIHRSEHISINERYQLNYLHHNNTVCISIIEILRSPHINLAHICYYNKKLRPVYCYILTSLLTLHPYLRCCCAMFIIGGITLELHTYTKIFKKNNCQAEYCCTWFWDSCSFFFYLSYYILPKPG